MIVLPSTLDERSRFCICSFMKKIYVIGGYRGKQENFGSCINSSMCYDIKNNKWTYVASMIESRNNASCAVFEGKIVVTGGFSTHVRSGFKSVEADCFHENKGHIFVICW